MPIRYGLITVVLALQGCTSTPEVLPTLVPVGQDIAYSPEQAQAICYSEALNVRNAVRSSAPTRVVVNTAPSGGGFGGGFAEGFNQSYNPRPSGNTEGKAAYAACAARLGYVVR